MKLLPRLYNAESGRILIDNYDISKVELYSLRQQVGIVPQDSLLFEGSIQDNIALTNPQAEYRRVLSRRLKLPALTTLLWICPGATTLGSVSGDLRSRADSGSELRSPAPSYKILDC